MVRLVEVFWVVVKRGDQVIGRRGPEWGKLPLCAAPVVLKANK